MADISVKYMGLDLKSPIIAGSCSLTSDVAKVREAEAAGAGAIVVKSLFEEQIHSEAGHIAGQSHDYAESADYIHYFVRQNSIDSYCENVRQLKNATGIPVIGSINCYTDGEWIKFAKEIASAGADALEVNIYSMPVSLKRKSADVEKEDIAIIKDIVKAVDIPVSVKISSYFTALPYFIDKLASVGAKAAVMFNRFYMPDIDIDRMEIVPSSPFSSKDEYVKELRSIAIVSSLVRNIDISATTGIHSPESAVKAILAGATTVQLCSVLFKSGMGVIRDFNSFISSYLDKHGFGSLREITGRLNYSSISEPDKFERTQFAKIFGTAK